MRSVMKHSFSEVPRANIPRSSFNRSHGYKTTLDADYLIPVFVDDVVPGDTFNCNMTFMARLATPIHPIMDNLYLESFFFFIPYRLLWTNWTKMHGEQDSPGDSIDYTVPVVTGSNIRTREGSLWDYFGLPLDLDPDDLPTSALPFRAYSLIYNEWFRDQNLQDTVAFNTSDTASTLTAGKPTSGNVVASDPVKRGKRHDYFTSCLPWPQKGDAVQMDLGTSAPIASTAADLANIIVQDGLGTTNVDNLNAASTFLRGSTSTTGSVNLLADLANATGPSINALRLAFQTQRLLERDARSGTRYNEIILSHFGVTVPDFRVQRPEFLGGGSTPININAVAQTSGQVTPVANDKLGELAGIGVASGSHGFTKSFVEHGLVMGLINVRSDITYQQGQERYWAKSTRYDFYYPVLAQIGEQAVLNKEIYAQGDGATNDDNVFGYQERYAEYRYKPSRVTGLFNSNATGTLDTWHLSENFGSLPTLGDTFIESNTGTPLDRCIAVSSEPHLIFDSYFNLQCARPMPLYGVPGNLDHF